MHLAPRETETTSPEALAAHYGLRLSPDLKLLPSIKLLKRFDDSLLVDGKEEAFTYKDDINPYVEGLLKDVK